MRKIALLTFTAFLALSAGAQNLGKRIWLSGQARNVLYFDQYQPVGDTVTPSRQNSGHTMVDLAANIQPNKSTFIHGMVRIRNDYGGFWSGGVTFDVRQMYVKGIIANAIRYQVGDINYKLTPYTLRNPDHDLDNVFLDYTNAYRELLDYDLFYDFENSWRQQGAAVDFALQFKRYIKEIQFNGFISRQNPSNFSTINERLYAGGNMTLIQGDFGEAGLNYINMFDLLGTANDSLALSNPIMTAIYKLKYDKEDYMVALYGELGNSNLIIRNDTNAPDLTDYFFDLGVKAKYKPLGIKLKARYKNVGPRFFSPGAQTRRMNWNSAPLSYSRYGNAQSIRSIGLLDVIRDASIYNTTLQTGLGAFNPAYGNATPYGEATPNRQGVIVDLMQKDEKKRWDISANLSMLSEVVGSGTSELKSFTSYRALANVYVNNFLSGWDKQIKLSASVWSETTDRTSSFEFEKVNLQNNAIDVALDVEFMKNAYILVSLRSLSSVGTDFWATRNAYREVVNYVEYENDFTETLTVLGGRYRFSEKTSLSLLYSLYNADYRDGITESYGMNTMSILFNMKF
jgi:hypothetical protein